MTYFGELHRLGSGNNFTNGSFTPLTSDYAARGLGNARDSLRLLYSLTLFSDELVIK